MQSTKITKVVFWILVAIAAVTIIKSAKAMKDWQIVSEVNEERMLNSIKAIENSNGKTGALGEHGAYQINPKTWAEHSSIPIAVAPSYYHDVVARNILRHYAAILRKRGSEVTPYNLALCWCSGPYRKTPSKRALDYASRLQNIYQSINETHHR